MAMTETISPQSERVLRWLERYPLQRTQDLVVALAPWQKRTSVYQQVRQLWQDHLLEELHAGVAHGQRLYHLSPLGGLVCAQRASQERWERLGITQVVREERSRLERLLPRLPVYLLLQDLVNGLVSHASKALAHQGRLARLVQWNWQRDYTHAFAPSRGEVVRVRADGVLAFCVRFDAMVQAHSEREGWVTLLLLHVPLDDRRLMQIRLDRLLRWRESAERSRVYRQMPPVLILATTERQAEWWHQAAVQVADRLRVDRLTGAIACPARSPEALANGWRLSWSRLATKEGCHLQELLHAFPQPGVPELRAEGSLTPEPRLLPPTGQWQGVWPARMQKRTYALQPVARIRTPVETRPARPRPREERLTSVTLTPRHWEILHLCFAHPFLSRENLSLLLALSRTSINLLLADLVHAGYLTGVETPVDERWQVSEAGLRLLAGLAWCQVHRLVRLPLSPGKPLEQRGALGLLKQIRHTAGVYGFFAQLTQAYATLPNAQVRWWETGVLSERHFVYREKTYRFRPDALAEVALGQRRFRFWLEWDRGTMTPQDLRVKFATYAMYLTSREWAASSPILPALVCVTPEIGQERRMGEAATHCLTQAQASLRMYTTTASRLALQGILAPIWQFVSLAGQQVQDGRKALFTERVEHL